MRDGWELRRMEELCRITRGASPRPIHEWISASGTPWVKIADATRSRGRSIDVTRERIRDEGREKSVVVQPGDLIVSNSATPGIPKFMGIEACIHDGWLLLRDFAGVTPEFLYYRILVDRPFLVGQGNGSVFTNLKTAILKSHLIPLPPLDEQRRIAGVLGALDDLADACSGMASRLEALALTLFRQRGFDAEGDVPLVEVLEIAPTYPIPRGPVRFVEMPALAVGSSQIEYVSARNQATGTRFMNGDTLLARITPSLENGKTGFVDVLLDGEVACGSTEFIVMRGRANVPNEWVYCLARSDRFRDFAIHSMTGTSGRQRVSAQAISGYCVAPIHRGDLERFGEVVRPIFRAMHDLRIEARQARATRNELLPLLMSGRIRVGDVESAV